MDNKYQEKLFYSEDSLRQLFGECDSYIKKLEKDLSVDVTLRGDALTITGEERNVIKATSLLNELAILSKEGHVDRQKFEYGLSCARDGEQSHLEELDKDVICHCANGRPVKPKTVGQQNYVRAMKDHIITFGIGPAGTGKTYLAMAMAIAAFKAEEVERIILTRPAIEAGEKLGFLPGDLQSKIDPYLRPLYDALYQIMGPDSFNRNMEKGLIEVAPLAYMRGRTLDNSYIILDEAQNTTPAQMKMFLTRIGFHSKVVVTGDQTQKDLPKGTASGLDDALKILKNVDEIAVCKLTGKDVVRHPLVQRIIECYDQAEKNAKRR